MFNIYNILYYRDRIRSTSSVVSHTFCTAVVFSLCKGDLDKIDEKHKIVRNQTELTILEENPDLKVNAANNAAAGSLTSECSTTSDSNV